MGIPSSPSHMDPVWRFIPRDPRSSTPDGNRAKLFKGERVKTPGAFELDAPSKHAVVLIREATQNAWDSAIAMRKELQATDRDPPPALEFTHTYHFAEARGEDKAALVSALGLDELALRIQGTRPSQNKSQREILGLTHTDCLNELEGDLPLRVLRIHETASGGMFGDWEDGPSKLHSALCDIGTNDNQEGGGSFGYGKAGIIRASKIHTVVAYTCFRERTSEEDEYAAEGLTHQLLGCAYWGGHQYEGHRYPGEGRLGDGLDPLTNDDANAKAQQLGFWPRDPSDPYHWGTSLLVVEPTVEPADLLAAAERNWWPALEDDICNFSIKVIDYGREEAFPQPRRQTHLLGPFLETYETIVKNPASPPPSHRYEEIKVSGRIVGRLCLTHDLGGWSTPSGPPSNVKHASLVALVRDPRMIIEYFSIDTSQKPYIRGTFVADEAVNDDLRATEPRGHDEWQTTAPAEDVPPAYTSLARELRKAIRKSVRVYRDALAIKVEPEERPSIPILDGLSSSISKADGGSRNSPPTGPRPFKVVPGGAIVTTELGRRAEGTATVRYNDAYDWAGEADVEFPIRVTIRYQWESLDGTEAADGAWLIVCPPSGFVPSSSDSRTFEGALPRTEPAYFTYASVPYSEAWSARISVVATFAQDPSSHTQNAVPVPESA